MRTRTSFQKRQKELARMEKQRDKAARRLARKQEKATGEPDAGSEETLDPSAHEGSDEPVSIADNE